MRASTPEAYPDANGPSEEIARDPLGGELSLGVGSSTPLREAGAPGRLPVAVIGAGPIGLAAAAHLLEQGMDPLVLEAGDVPATGVAQWGHVRLFTPWAYNIDTAAERLLIRHGWTRPDAGERPTGAQLRDRYLVPLTELPELRSRLRLNARVRSVARSWYGLTQGGGQERAAFELVIEGPRGRERLLASAVIDASGTISIPNPLGGSGTAALGEEELGDRIAYGVPDVLGAERSRYAGRRALVVGSGHSAMNVLQDLIQLRDEDTRTTVAWAVRRRELDGLFGDGAADTLPARAALGARTHALVETGAIELETGVVIEAVRETELGIEVRHSEGRIGLFDEIIASTGFRPDLAPLRSLQLDLDPALEAPSRLVPLIDPANHSCATVPVHGVDELRHPESNFYVAGMKSYGRAPTFLLLTGYEQVRSIATSLAGHRTGTREVHEDADCASPLPAGLCCSAGELHALSFDGPGVCEPWPGDAGRGCAC